MWSLFKKKYPITFPAGSHGMSNEYIDRDVLDIMARLRSRGFEAYLVGGSIRDILLGKRVKDFDIVTDAHPRQIKRLFKRCFLIGKRFRLAHVYVSRDRFIEVATFRALVETGELQDTGKKYAENNVFGTIEEDALRRDFTINALYYNSADSSIEDYTGGMEDIKKRLLRSIGDPIRRFQEDPVRIIRAGRFCAQLNFSLPRKERRAAEKCAHLIADANTSRLLEELYKILRCGASAATFENLRQFGVLKFWLPELAESPHWDNMMKRLTAVDNRRARGQDIPNAILIASLLFDLFADAVGEKGEKISHQEIINLIRANYNTLATRLRLPRKEWDIVTNIASRVWIFKRFSAQRRMKGEAKFVHNAYFPESLKFFEIYAEAAGSLEPQLKYWWQKEREYLHRSTPSQAGSIPTAVTANKLPPHSVHTDERPHKAKRRRKRHRPKRAGAPNTPSSPPIRPQ